MTKQILFVFSGQGSQWKTMGRDLLISNPTFRTTIEQVDPLFEKRLGWSVIEELKKEEEHSNVLTSSIAQPLIFSLQIGLIETLRSWGISPNMIVGHSVGEVAAAYRAGVFSLETGVDIICAQNRLLRAAEGNGAMLFVAKSAKKVMDIACELSDAVSVAAVNSPGSCVLSGDAKELQVIESHFQDEEIFTKWLPIDIPFHSPLIHEYLNELTDHLPEIKTSEPLIPIVSTLTGKTYESGNYGQEYWVDHIKEPVLFADAVAKAFDQGATTVIEIGPHAVLSGSMIEIAQQQKIEGYLILSSLRREQPGKEELFQMVAQLSNAGHDVNESAFDREDWSIITRYKEQIQSRESMRLRLDQAGSDEERKSVLREFVISAINLLTNGKVLVAEDDQSGFFELGMDSVTSVRVKSEIEKGIQHKLPATLLFDYPNMDRLVNFLVGKLGINDEGSDQEEIEKFDATTNPISIVGMSCRFPGGANSLNEYWDMLISGKNGISEIPEDRWPLEDHFSEGNEAGKMNVKMGGFLKDVNLRNFDADFFKISPKEARAMDPQQKLLLEVVWEALENAGINPEELKGKNVGVYLGISTDDYKRSHIYANELTKIDAYTATGSVFSAAGGRISFFLGLEGPNISVDTACSSSLVATHLASQAIRNGECDMAIVAGVNGILAPNFHVYFSKLQAISPDGLCKSFDDSANGYVRSEGCGALVLTTWKEAQKAGNKVLAVVKGTAVNQDGASSGFTAPNGIAQQKVARKALAMAELNPSDVSYVEAHGTGTPLGDPIEIAALSEVYGKNRQNGELLLGSVKSNIGHMEAAAGMGSLIKSVLALQNKTVPQNLHFRKPNSKIDWKTSGVKVVAENTNWISDSSLAVGISGFGFSGTNSHIVLQEPPTQEKKVSTIKEGEHLVALSAKTEDGLNDQIQQYAEYLNTSDQNLAAIAYSSLMHRAHFGHRASFVAKDKSKLIDQLNQFDTEKSSTTSTKMAFLFTGQGAQYPQMGRALFETNDVFRSTVEKCDELFVELTGESLIELIYGEIASQEKLTQTRYTQPALFAFEFALARYWESLGVTPSIMVGHSVGEYVAACLAGVFTLEEGMKLITSRGQLMYSLPLDGGMMSVFSTEKEILELLQETNIALDVAIINAPTNTVVSGDLSEIDSLEKVLTDRSIKYKRLTVSHAFHSRKMNPILDEFKAIASQVEYRKPNIPIVCNVTGKLAEENDLVTPEYWCDHLRMAVRYAQSAEELRNLGVDTFIEVGPSPTLISLGRQNLDGFEANWLPSFSKKSVGKELLFASLGKLYELGYNLNWKALYNNKTWEPVNLPTYPFQREEYWMEPDAPLTNTNQWVAKNAHPFIGQKLSSPILGENTVYTTQFSAKYPVFLKEHLVFEKMISPAAAHLSMLLSYAKHGEGNPMFQAKDIQFIVPLAVEEDELLDVQLIVEGNDTTAKNFQLVSKSETKNDWKKHCVGQLAWNETEKPANANIQELIAESEPGIEASTFHSGLWNNGLLKLGSSFQRIAAIWTNENGSISRLDQLEDLEEANFYEIHPGMMDSILQSCIFSSDEMVDRLLNGELFIPYGLTEMRYYPHEKSAVYWCETKLNELSSEVLNGNVTVFNEAGETVLEIVGLTVKKVRERALLNALNQSSFQNAIYQMDWEDVSLELNQEKSDHSTVLFTQTNAPDWARELSDVTIHSGKEMDLSNRAVIKNVLDTVRTKSVSVIYIGNDSIEAKESIEQNTKALLAIAQELIQTENFDKKSLRILTQKVHDNHSAEPFGSVLWGMAKVLTLEHDELNVAVIDDCHADKSVLSNVVLSNELVGFYRIEGEVVQTQRIVKRRKEYSEEKPKYNDKGAYLVTGGFGALGKRCAQRMIQQGCKSLALIGRNADSERARKVLEELSTPNVQIQGYSCDVSDEKAVQELIGRIKQEFGAIKGIMHVAGVLSDGSFTSMTWERFEELYKAKVYGAWNLHQHTLDAQLEFFLTFSSISSVFGNQGQANYSAANYFLDGLVRMRRSLGLPASTINWGPWGESGMAAQEEKRGAIQAKGLEEIDPDTYLDLMDYVLANPEIEQIVSVKCDWSKLLSKLPESAHAFYSRVHQSDGSQQKTDSQVLLMELNNVSHEQAQEILMDHVVNEVKSSLGYDRSASLDPDKSLTELGADSLMAVELRNNFGKSIGKNLPISLLYNYPTITAMVDFLLNEVKGEEAEQEEVETESEENNELAESLNEMSEEDLLTLINSELDT